MLKQQITLQVQQPHTSPLTPRLLTCTPVSASPLRALACPYYSLDLFAKANWILIWVTRKFQIRILIQAETALSPPSHHSPSTESVCRILYTIYIPYPDCWILYPESDCSVRSTVRRQWQTFLLCFNVSFGASSFLPCAFFLLLFHLLCWLLLLLWYTYICCRCLYAALRLRFQFLGPAAQQGATAQKSLFVPFDTVVFWYPSMDCINTKRLGRHYRLMDSKTAFVLASQWT